MKYNTFTLYIEHVCLIFTNLKNIFCLIKRYINLLNIFCSKGLYIHRKYTPHPFAVMSSEYKTKFSVIFDSEKKLLLREFKDNPDLLETILKAPTNHLDLRKTVVKSMEPHPQMRQWVRLVYRGKKRDYNKFLCDQSKPGVFTDNDGLAVISTADYLGVNYHMAGTCTSSCIQDWKRRR